MFAYTDSPSREEIAQSWHRVQKTGLDPEASFDVGGHEVDLRSSLLAGASPVLEELEDHLRGSNYATLLVDRDCRVVRRWCDDPRVANSFDHLQIAVGGSLLEENVGTNALGTPLITRRGIAINGSEHFAASLKRFSCYGQPIQHPLTKRIEGVLDISAIAEEASPLLPALIARAVHDIEQRLLDGSRTSEKNLLRAFQSATRRQGGAILAIGEDILVSNHAANDLLSPTDTGLLRALVKESQVKEHQTFGITLESGRAVSIEASRVDGARRGALLRVSAGRAQAVRSRPPDRLPDVDSPRAISGANGSGRTTRAREIAADRAPLKIMRPAAALLEGSNKWAMEFEAAMRRRSGTVCVAGIDLLPDELLDLIIDWTKRANRPDLIFTSGPASGLTGRAATLLGMAMRREDLAPLAARRHDIPGIATAMLKQHARGRDLHLSPSLVEALATQAWPGNLRELNAVIQHLAQKHSVGALTVADLPSQYRSRTPGPRLTALDQAARDIIISALRTADGNKTKAAKELDMSRTTLYARMRTLRITTY